MADGEAPSTKGKIGDQQAQRERAGSSQRAEAAALAEVATGDWSRLVQKPASELAVLLSTRITEMARQLRFAEVAQAAAKLRELAASGQVPSPANLFYNAACGYSLCAQALRATDQQPLAPAEQEKQKKWLSLSLDCLRQSLASGWKDMEHLQKDPDLRAVRAQPEFHRLVASPSAALSERPPQPLAPQTR